MRSLDPRLRVLYLGLVAGGAFAFRDPRALAAIAASQVLLWLVVGLGPRRLLRQVWKLAGIASIIVLSFAFFGEDPGADAWVEESLFGVEIPINVGGLAAGGAMV